MTYAKFLGSGTKCDTSDPDSLKLGNKWFNLFTTTLKNLCKTFPILFDENYDTFHSFCVCLIKSHILNLESLVLISECIWLPYQISLGEFVHKDPSSDSSSIDDLSIEAEIDSSSSAFRLFPTKYPSTNYAKVMMSTVFSWDDVVCGIYETTVHIENSSEYGNDMYSNAL